MATDKEIIRDSILILKRKKIIKYDTDIAKALGYTPGALSEMINPKSKKPVTYAFKQKFKEYYGKYLGDIPIENVDKFEELAAWIEVLKETCVGILSNSSGKQQALISAELGEAVKLKLKK